MMLAALDVLMGYKQLVQDIFDASVANSAFIKFQK